MDAQTIQILKRHTYLFSRKEILKTQNKESETWGMNEHE